MRRAGPLRLCLLTSSQAIGGLERLLHRLAPSLAERGFEVRVALLAGRGPFVELMRELPAPQVEIFDLRSARAPLEHRRLQASLRAFEPDAIHAFGFRADLASRLTHRRLGRPVLVSTVANPDLARPPWVRLLNRLTSRRVAAYWADCQARADAGRSLGIPAEKTKMIYPGVDLPEEPLSKAARQEAKRKLGLDPAVPLLLVVGNLRQVKGHHLAIEAAPEIVRHHPGTTLVFLGADASGGELPAQAAASEASASLRLMGYEPKPERYYQAADLLLQPSLSEGLPRATLEAMAHGVPAVATTVGGLPELIDDGVDGGLIAPGDVEALARVCVELLWDREKLAELGRRAREKVAARFSHGACVEGFATWYAELG